MTTARTDLYHPSPPGRKTWVMILLALVMLVMFLLDIALGPVRIPLKSVIRIIFSLHGGDDTWRYIVTQIRIPKAFTAVIAGCGLSVSGLQMQTLFRNPLAESSVLGVTAGASLGVAAVMLGGGGTITLFTIRELGISGSWLIALAGSIGAAGVMLLVIMISGRIRDNIMMLIVGVMVGTVTLSIISIWQYFSESEMIKDYLIWTFGSLGGVTGAQLYILGLVTMAGLILSFLSSKMLDALLLGDNYARSMGVATLRARIIIICSTSLMAGCITAFCGPIGFIGIAVPQMARSVFSTSDHRTLIPACCLIGATLIILCDLIGQLPGSQTALPINIITALVGAPMVIWIILSKKNLSIYG